MNITLNEHQKNYINDNAKAWIEVLLDNQLPQGKGVLQNPAGGYCCLGVACKVYEESTGNMLHKDHDNPEVYPSWRAALVEDFAVVKDWIGLHYSLGEAFGDSFFHSLSGMNDRGTSFKEIGEQLLAHPEAYFQPVN